MHVHSAAIQFDAIAPGIVLLPVNEQEVGGYRSILGLVVKQLYSLVHDKYIQLQFFEVCSII